MTPSHTSFRGEPRREGRKPEVLPLVYDKESVLTLLKSKDMFYQPVSDKFTSNIEALDDVQISLVEHTEIDNMDENNKFICKNCIESKGFCYVVLAITYHIEGYFE